MPIYEYKCQKCGFQFEKLQSFNASRQQTCPKCSGTAERLLSLGSFVLKGGGWYATEHRPKPCQETKTTPEPACATKCESCPAAN